MKRSRHVSAPILAATAIGLLAGCHPASSRSVPRPRAVSARNVQGVSTTKRDGFGETYGPWILAGGAIFVILGAGS